MFQTHKMKNERKTKKSHKKEKREVYRKEGKYWEKNAKKANSERKHGSIPDMRGYKSE